MKEEISEIEKIIYEFNVKYNCHLIVDEQDDRRSLDGRYINNMSKITVEF